MWYGRCSLPLIPTRNPRRAGYPEGGRSVDGELCRPCFFGSRRLAITLLLSVWIPSMFRIAADLRTVLPPSVTIGTWVLLVAMGLMTAPAEAQRKIEGRRYGGGNSSGQALGSGTGNRPNGQLGRDALGSGNALDGNLEVGSGGRNGYSPRAAAFSYQAIQARNLGVTNNVAGGRGFRGDPGYTAPRDFRGKVGGDDIYDFQRDSALSSMQFLTSPQRLDPFNISNNQGAFQYRRDFTSLPEVNNAFAARQIGDAQIRLDRVDSTMTTGSLLTTAAVPEDAGFTRGTVTSSSVRGLQPALRTGGYQPQNLFDEALMYDAIANPGPDEVNPLQPRPFRSPWEDEDGNRLKAKNQIDGIVSDGLNTPTPYETIVQRVIENYAGRENINIDDSGILRMREDRSLIEARIVAPRIGTPEDARPRDSSGSFDGLSRPEDDPEAGIGPDFRRSLTEFDLGDPEDEEDLGQESPSTDTGEQAGSEEEETNLRSSDDLFEVYQHRTEVDDLQDSGLSERARELVEQAEGYMLDNKYAKATDRLKDAKRLSPGNPMIEAGLANSQIGFGAYFSAELTLAKLFTRNPELAGAVFSDPKIIPNRTNLLIAANDLRSRLAAGRAANSKRNAGLGLVLAYIGWQVSDRTMVEEGLSEMTNSPQAGLEELLRAIWLAPVPE